MALRKFQNNWPAWVVLFFGLLASLWVSLHLRNTIDEEALVQFSIACDQITIKVTETLDNEAQILRGGVALFAASNQVSRQEWYTFVTTLRASDKQGMGYAQRVPDNQIAAHHEQLRAEGLFDYTVYPASNRETHAPVIYFEPLKGENLKLIGYDMYTDVVRRNAMDQARDTGKHALTGRVRLSQDKKGRIQTGVLMYDPVYRQGASLATVASRQAALLGWVFKPYHLNELLADALTDQSLYQGKTLSLHIYDGQTLSDVTLLTDTHPNRDFSVRTPFYQQRTIVFNDHIWTLAFERDLKVVPISHLSSFAAMAGGIILFSAIFVLMRAVSIAGVTSSDLSEVLAREVELRTAELVLMRDTAQAANQAKSTFLANMSHEIRTPMNGVLGMVDILQQTQMTDTQRYMVATVHDSSLALLNILNDILDYSKIEAGMMSVEMIPTYLREVVEGAAQLMITISEAKFIDFSVFVSPELPLWIETDPTRLRQILLNLLGNAIKFTSNMSDRTGRVSLRVEPCALNNGSGLRFCITDNGIGMSQSTQDSLFQPFTQADLSTARKYGGTGLGLSITQHLIQLLGGKLSVSSQPDEGSVFMAVVPLLTAAPSRVLPSAPDLQGLPVLLVTPNTVQTVPLYCQSAGAKVDVVADMAGARQFLQHADPCTVVVLSSSITLPSDALDLPAGVQVIRFVRRSSTGYSGAEIKVQSHPLLYMDLLNALGMASGRIASQQKPLESRRVERRKSPRGQPPTVDEARQAGRLILLAEDNPINRAVMLQQLQLLGNAAETACDGVQALEMWRTGQYALLLTDCHMPNMDGFELTKKIRSEEPAGSHLTIIAVTANAMQGEVQNCIDQGMDDYLSKPLRLADLRAMLGKWLPRKVVSQPAVAEVSPALPEDNNAVVQTPVWDEQALVLVVGDDPANLCLLLNAFLESAPAQIISLCEAAQAGEIASVISLAHGFKSVARTMGGMQLGDLCQALEIAGRAGEAENCSRMATQLHAQYAACRDEILKNLNAQS